LSYTELVSARHLLLLAAPPVLVLGLPLLIATLALARVVFLPPVANTRLLGFDGLQVHGGCLDGTNGPRGRLWECRWDVHLDSRFAIVAHDPAAMEWCAALVRNDSNPNSRTVRLGRATLGLFPAIWSGWTGCGQMIPLQAGFYFDLSIEH
jgi:hypothetical protein